MSSLPLLPKVYKKSNPNKFLRNSSILRMKKTITKTANSSLQKQAIDTVHRNNYLYIDFNANYSLIQLEPQSRLQYEQEDEVQQIGTNSITGMNQLQGLSLPSFRMHRFLNQEKHHIQKRRKWNQLLGKSQFRDTIIDFNKVKQKVSPEKLEEFLENKNIQNQWRRIIQRQEVLYAKEHPKNSKMLSHNSVSLSPSKPKAFSRAKIHTKFKLKALDNFNSLLSCS